MNRIYIVMLSCCSLSMFAQTEAQLDSLYQTLPTDLGEVFIRVNKPVFQQKADKMVFNVENSTLSEGSTILEVLGRAPGVVVSQEGELSLRGKKGVSVMINGKLSSLSSKELANLLRSTNSSAVKNIEIIANPSAKYDATGNAGIINIVLKKSVLEGLNGSVYTSVGRGRKNRMNTGMNINYNHKGWSVFADYSYTFRGEEERKTFDQDFFDASSLLTRQTVQHYKTSEPLTSNNFKWGTDYQFNAKTSIGILFDAKIGRYENKSKGISDVYAPVSTLYSSIATDNYNDEHWYDYTYSVHGAHQFAEEGTRLDFDIEYEQSKFRSLQTQLQETLVATADAYPNRRGKIPSTLRVFNGKLDFTIPLWDNHTLETGWKSTVKTNDNPSVYEIEENNHWAIDPITTNHYDYKEQIHALYANYKATWDHWQIQVGLRNEYTDRTINQKTTAEHHQMDYNKLFPSASIKYETDQAHSYYASYSKRINRPSHFDLNPFRFYNDPFNYWQGNVNVRPEITHATEVGYSWSKYLIASIYFSQTNDVMTQVYSYEQDQTIMVKTLENLSKSYHYGATLTATSNPTDFWTLSSMFNLFNNQYKGTYQETTIDSKQVAFTLNAQNSFTFSKGIKAEINAQYFSKSNIGLYKRDAYFDLTIGASKSVFKDKGSIKLALTDVLKTNNFTIIGDNFDSKVKQKYDLDSRIATLSFNYKF
ncbi:outer membrane beta-barrel family protein [Myroides odoratus]|uniref:Outer membrane receptor for Fe3+-dicitrate n=1 Tax=Myroides odoratus TaxID=256 RepID=A0A378RJZ3_MYROD|nr:outer membrane beta-barrel family protein [Myroides odoratus]QQU05194.1 TonB-dependent receptor [Myroides odoratus]STZ27314.1 Outer membrane receptor for Fe3+-dicitrate [Myroides odoratus]